MDIATIRELNQSAFHEPDHPVNAHPLYVKYLTAIDQFIADAVDKLRKFRVGEPANAKMGELYDAFHSHERGKKLIPISYLPPKDGLDVRFYAAQAQVARLMFGILFATSNEMVDDWTMDPYEGRVTIKVPSDHLPPVDELVRRFEVIEAGFAFLDAELTELVGEPCFQLTRDNLGSLLSGYREQLESSSGEKYVELDGRIIVDQPGSN